MAEKIPHWQSHTFLRAFLWKDGEEGCEICEDAEVKISLDRPPPMGNSPKSVLEQSQKGEKDQQKEDSGKFLNVLLFPWAIAREIRKARAWAATPEPLKLLKPSKAVPVDKVKKESNFDIQQIPSVMRTKLNLPIGAAMLQKWFDGDINFARNSKDLGAEINQRGEPYPAKMIDTQSVKIKWVLSFKRAEQAAIELINDLLRTENAIKQIRKKLAQYRDREWINSVAECGGDAQKMHRLFQFQLVKVESSWAQRVKQFATQEVLNRGMPDELTFVLGSFAIYAAIGEAFFYKITGGTEVIVSRINVYVRDSFDFFDPPEELSQYLGHWNKDGVAIVPLAQIKGVRLLIESPGRSRALRIDRRFYYSVRNSDFREWQHLHGRGGDYMIYTDILTKQLIKPISLIIPNAYEARQ
jgi:hypothetical protein